MITGKGLVEALEGVACIVDVASGASPEEHAATEFFRRGRVRRRVRPRDPTRPCVPAGTTPRRRRSGPHRARRHLHHRGCQRRPGHRHHRTRRPPSRRRSLPGQGNSTPPHALGTHPLTPAGGPARPLPVGRSSGARGCRRPPAPVHRRVIVLTLVPLTSILRSQPADRRRPGPRCRRGGRPASRWSPRPRGSARGADIRRALRDTLTTSREGGPPVSTVVLPVRVRKRRRRGFDRTRPPARPAARGLRLWCASTSRPTGHQRPEPGRRPPSRRRPEGVGRRAGAGVPRRRMPVGHGGPSDHHRPAPQVARRGNLPQPGCRCAAPDDPAIRAAEIIALFKRAARAAGLAGDYASRSFRAGFVTDALDAGATREQFQRHGRWANSPRSRRINPLDPSGTPDNTVRCS